MCFYIYCYKMLEKIWIHYYSVIHKCLMLPYVFYSICFWRHLPRNYKTLLLEWNPFKSLQMPGAENKLIAPTQSPLRYNMGSSWKEKKRNLQPALRPNSFFHDLTLFVSSQFHITSVPVTSLSMNHKKHLQYFVHSTWRQSANTQVPIEWKMMQQLASWKHYTMQ